MSRDIRSYFLSAGANGNNKPSKKRPLVLSDDEDDNNDQINAEKRKKLAEKKKKRKHVLSDSDEETSPVKSKIRAKKEKTPELKEVSTKDMFASRPVKREAAPIVKILEKPEKKPQKSKKESKKALLKKEAEFHSDDDFEATLCQLDMSQIEEGYISQESNKCSQNLNNSGDSKSEKSETKTESKKLDKDKSSGSSALKSSHNTESTKKSPKSHRNKESKDSSPKKKSSISDSTDEDIYKKKEGGKLNFSKLNTKKTSSSINIEIEKKPTQKKENNDSSDVFAEIIEKKKQSAALYQQYLHRGGARNPGSKEIPQGAEYCLAGLSFLVTGVLDSLERDECDELITKYGGRILHSVSKKLNYMIVGEDPGPAKISKGTSLGVKMISENDLLDMIRTRPAGKASAVLPTHSKKDKERGKLSSTSSTEEKEHTKTSSEIVNNKEKESVELISQKEEPKCVKVKPADVKELPKVPKFDNTIKSTVTSTLTENATEMRSKKFETLPTVPTLALNEKYRPKTMKTIIGQTGEQSNAKKLYKWLSNWHKNHNSSTKQSRPRPGARDDTGAFFKAALLSGPPGVGKTTTVQVVCKELGFDLLEFNASDTRSKKLLHEEVSTILKNNTMTSYYTKSEKEQKAKNHVLLMDEVDGMAGNEDRGGLKELVALIKSTEVPIVCICNDRNHPKMRTLSNYVYNLRYQKPRIEQIKGAMLSLCYKENIKITPEELSRLIESTNQDIRQVINHLALLSSSTAGSEETKNNNKQNNKDLKLGPWDVVRKVFSSDEHKTMTIHDKSDLFFHDYSIAPLFVHENYLSVIPNAPSPQLLSRVADSMDSLATGDLVEKSIRGSGAWSLLPVQACFSSVIPGSIMSGRIVSQINFPAWLGRNSRKNKMDRLAQEITVHTRLTTGASKEAINLDYLNALTDAIVRPLAVDGSDGVESTLNVMNEYHLMRDDLDSLIELSSWPGKRDPMQAVDSKVKAAFTRAYNKKAASMPYAAHTAAAAKKKTAQASQDEGFGEDEEEEHSVSDEEDETLTSDNMVKATTSSNKKGDAAGSKAPKKPSKRGGATSGRGRGRGK